MGGRVWLYCTAGHGALLPHSDPVPLPLPHASQTDPDETQHDLQTLQNSTDSNYSIKSLIVSTQKCVLLCYGKVHLCQILAIPETEARSTAEVRIVTKRAGSYPKSAQFFCINQNKLHITKNYTLSRKKGK